MVSLDDVNSKLNFIIGLLIPILFYLIGLELYLFDLINAFIFYPFIFIGAVFIFIYFIIYRRQKKERISFSILGLIFTLLLLFEFKLVDYEANTYTATTYIEPLEVVENSNIHVMLVQITNVPYIDNVDMMLQTVSFSTGSEVLDYSKVTNIDRYASKNRELLSYILPETNYFDEMKENVEMYLGNPSPLLDAFLNRDDIEGDSVGLALVLSDYFEQGKVNNKLPLAVTGAIDEKGRVIEIGSAKAKTLIAEENHFPYIILPKENAAEAEKVKKEQKLNIEIIPVETVEEAIEEINRINAF